MFLYSLRKLSLNGAVCFPVYIFNSLRMGMSSPNIAELYFLLKDMYSKSMSSLPGRNLNEPSSPKMIIGGH